MKKGIETVMGNHLFRWGGQTYMQKDGGSIGLRMTGSICRVVMDNWLNKFKQKAVEIEIEIKLVSKYVDDINLYVYAMEGGTWWKGGKRG